MKTIILQSGALILLNLVSLGNLIMTLLAQRYEAVWPVIFILVIDILYFVQLKRNDSARKEDY